MRGAIVVDECRSRLSTKWSGKRSLDPGFPAVCDLVYVIRSSCVEAGCHRKEVLNGNTPLRRHEDGVQEVG